MKSKVASSLISRARSARKIVAPFNTPIRTSDSPSKSLVIRSPSSASLFETCFRSRRTLSRSKRHPQVWIPRNLDARESARETQLNNPGPRLLSCRILEHSVVFPHLGGSRHALQFVPQGNGSRSSCCCLDCDAGCVCGQPACRHARSSDGTLL